MQIAPPFGYREIVPFLKTQKVRLLAPGEVPEFARRGNAIPISHTEFQFAARESAGENLFVASAAWARGVYVPAYARRYPFCMAKVTLNQVEQKDRLICIEKTFIDEQGEPMFDAQGQPSAKWSEIERLLSEYEADLERSREMCAILGDYGLLEPFTMQATLNKDKGGGAMHLTGMHRVNEKNLENLNAAQLKNLMRKGLMARVYLHLLSLENFARLLERKATRLAAAAD